MSLLPSFLRQFLKRHKHNKSRVFLRDEQVAVRVKKMAVSQRREEQEIYDEIIAAGMKAVQDRETYAAIWDSLSPREQQVAALTCLGYSSYKMADVLGVSYDTVRTHSKHIYGKFGLNRKQLRLALKDWDFQEWLESTGNGASPESR